MPSGTPSQLHTRARVIFLAALGMIAAAFASAMFAGTRAPVLVLVLLVLAAVLFAASVMVRRAGDAKRRAMERD
ncbi:hypothetical protein [Rubricoccus marinus]|uniref:Uncharacterized protein n=1 Tax=Rubricoccus marinus TaxID=716817 RepID=A0A259U395_9BACT|nr:hypothetical protein [Rubricoccus marinus]OZC04489.1 hypothetical protein BSZ36_16810 [Rubricoccus marinus]